MAKVIQSISIDPDLTAKAKAQGLNISEVCNTALRAALIETRIKQKTDEAEIEKFKESCGYIPIYDVYNDKSYVNLKQSAPLLKANVERIKKSNPGWDNPDGLMRYLASKYDKE